MNENGTFDLELSGDAAVHHTSRVLVYIGRLDVPIAQGIWRTRDCVYLNGLGQFEAYTNNTFLEWEWV